MSRNLLWFNLQAIKTAKWDYWSQRHLLSGFAEAPFYIATKTLLLFKKTTAQSFPCSNSDDTVRHVHARCRFLEALQLKHEISLIIASCVIMAFCSFATRQRLTEEIAGWTANSPTSFFKKPACLSQLDRVSETYWCPFNFLVTFISDQDYNQDKYLNVF